MMTNEMVSCCLDREEDLAMSEIVRHGRQSSTYYALRWSQQIWPSSGNDFLHPLMIMMFSLSVFA